uniref:Uncharacterized protein n=1 Tax=Chromera velia CCMP2878 TaxID=1169474 RepID=A0A0G4I250_9ALVE|eukprot:Cvel_10246.t1-p1 / transcript=Cvel_10246.t1 / gene=Cvel_10246 / organism=Chromera_velia_CCMP2878 / gene_product=hypothetical protein / transcript_product=hypothetical protein / location=Cvel_scaffold614:20638-21078(-) / protein_length=147 / sequence_SO=supercontig / SO=protein_coding / is_pseudo=false
MVNSGFALAMLVRTRPAGAQKGGGSGQTFGLHLQLQQFADAGVYVLLLENGSVSTGVTPSEGNPLNLTFEEYSEVKDMFNDALAQHKACCTMCGPSGNQLAVVEYRCDVLNKKYAERNIRFTRKQLLEGKMGITITAEDPPPQLNSD